MWIPSLHYGLFLTLVCCLDTLVGASGTRRRPGSNYSQVPVKLLYGESHGISWTDLGQTHRLPPLLTHMFMDVLGLDYHYRRRCLFYSGWDKIWSLPFSETGATAQPQVVVGDAGGAASVAVDWVADTLYWTSPPTHTVQRADLAGGHRGVVLTLKGNLSQHNNIVVDPYLRLLFLAADRDGILRSDLDAGSVEHVRVDGHGDKQVVSIALDLLQRRVYVSALWAHAVYLLSCEYDGSRALEIDLSDEWWHGLPTIGVFRDQLFWVHHGWRERDTVWKANITVGALTWEKEYTVKGTVLDPETKIWALKVYHPDLQESPKDDERELTPKAFPSVNGTLRQRSDQGIYFIMFCINIFVIFVGIHK